MHLQGTHKIVKFEITVTRLNFPLSSPVFSHDLDIFLYLSFLGLFIVYNMTLHCDIFEIHSVHIDMGILEKAKVGEVLTPRENFQL